MNKNQRHQLKNVKARIKRRIKNYKLSQLNRLKEFENNLLKPQTKE